MPRREFDAITADCGERDNDDKNLVWFHGERVKGPNDPKLSDREARHDCCMVGERRRPEAASVMRGAVRCSAWLGASGRIR